MAVTVSNIRCKKKLNLMRAVCTPWRNNIPCAFHGNGSNIMYVRVIVGVGCRCGVSSTLALVAHYF